MGFIEYEIDELNEDYNRGEFFFIVVFRDFGGLNVLINLVRLWIVDKRFKELV